MVCVKPYFFYTALVHFLSLPMYLYLYYEISKISILLILMPLSIHKYFIIVGYSCSNMNELLSVLHEEGFSMAAIAITVLHCFVSSALVTNSNTMLHHFHPRSVALPANGFFFMWFSFTLDTDNLFVIFEPLN